MKLKVILEVYNTINTQNKFVSKFLTVAEISISVSRPAVLLPRYRQKYRLMSKTVFDDDRLSSDEFCSSFQIRII